MVKPLTIAEVEYIAHQLAQRLLEWDEPIPEFGTRFPNVLESCLAAPFQTFTRRPLYRGLIGKAAMLFYLMVKNHPFKNGNKRIAMTTLLALLLKNGKWLRMDDHALYRFAKWVAESDPKVRAAVVAAIEKMVQSHLIAAPKPRTS
ncbi:Fic family protein [Candidatus Uhrbacteria bacterium]|nr:Fic family protein [Candidatus Uhrbacteria bacterium]